LEPFDEEHARQVSSERRDQETVRGLRGDGRGEAAGRGGRPGRAAIAEAVASEAVAAEPEPEPEPQPEPEPEPEPAENRPRSGSGPRAVVLALDSAMPVMVDEITRQVVDRLRVHSDNSHAR